MRIDVFDQISPTTNKSDNNKSSNNYTPRKDSEYLNSLFSEINSH